MSHPEGESLKVGFDGCLKLEFHGSKVTSDAGLLAYRDLDEALGLFDSSASLFFDPRTGRNVQHDIPSLSRQSVYSRLVVKKNQDEKETKIGMNVPRILPVCSGPPKGKP